MRHAAEARRGAGVRVASGRSDGGAPPAAFDFDGLAASAPTVAAGTREIVRSEGASDRVLLLHTERRDACLRAAFDASAPITARLVDAAGNVLATTNAPARQGVLGARGPVCVRKGDTVSALVEPAGTQVRWMAWATGS
ncbi:MAG: hypothetical protein M3O50_10320 [Myxococcota bacterium]|nr:hypothetical protein [Myxococcota bacterium]